MSKIKLGVIMGGMSTEHEVSIVSGTSIIKNLDKQKYDILPIYIDKQGKWFEYKEQIENINVLNIDDEITDIVEIENVITYLQQLDVVFPAVHGLYGEDGRLQGLLEMFNIPYVGSSVFASSVCMDKIYTKVIFEKAKILQANYMYIKKQKDYYVYVDKEFNENVLTLDEIVQKIEKKLGFPVFVKPSNSGSSVGVNRANNKDELKNCIEIAEKYDYKILIEEQITGKEVECAILGNEDIQASCIGEILSAEQFYSFDAKYKNNESKILIPAHIEKSVEEEIKRIAKKAFNAVDGKGLARVDFFVRNKDKKIYINEINTMPGFTNISMYPKLWENSEISYSELLDKLINLACKIEN